MNAIWFRRIWLALAGALVVAASACDDGLSIPASVANTVDTVTLAALKGTPIPQPSAYDVVNNRLARTELGEPFDIAFDLADQGGGKVYPAGALGFPPLAGIQASPTSFDDLTQAPEGNYQADSALAVEEGTVFVVRSRPESQFCSFLGALPRYAKFRVLELDTAARSVRLEVLADVNCGYRGLEPGVPTR